MGSRRASYPLSVLLKPPIALHDVRFFTFIGSLAIADAVEACGAQAQVKWPNDVLVNDKKIAGVLTDVHLYSGRVEYVILGIGVNLNIERLTMDRLYGEAAPGATSLQETLGRTVDRNVFAARLLECLEKWYFEFRAHGKRPLLQEWRQRSFLGRRVTIREADMHAEGVAMDLDEEGCLMVNLDDGSTISVREGEVLPIQQS